MNISIFGLGYVGVVTGACLAAKGHRIIGVDTQEEKVTLVRKGLSPLVEPGISEMFGEALKAGRLTATTDSAEAVMSSEASIVCVGTPSLPSGGLDLKFVESVGRQIADILRGKQQPHQVIFRSTMLPGSTRRLWEDEFAQTGRHQVFFVPEFLREGTAVRDFVEPSLSVIGTCDGGEAPATVSALFLDNAKCITWEAAELLKYACNAFHALKVCFANEVGRVGKHLGVDSRQVMELLCRDVRLNLSPYYMRPGNPFGGSCLPKDVSALVSLARREGVSLPVLENLVTSNTEHARALIRGVEASGMREVALIGLAFKSGTDDLRESPMLELAQYLIGRGYTVRIFDPQINVSRLIGQNEAFMRRKMPHLAAVLKDSVAETVGESSLVVISQRAVPFEDLVRTLNPSTHRIFDVNGWPELASLSVPYDGFCW